MIAALLKSLCCAPRRYFIKETVPAVVGQGPFYFLVSSANVIQWGITKRSGNAAVSFLCASSYAASVSGVMEAAVPRQAVRRPCQLSLVNSTGVK